MVDGRETAPAAVSRTQYFDRDGHPVSGASTRGGTSVAIPGMPAALVHVAQRYGRLPIGESLAPAVRYAREGFAVDPRFARVAGLRERLLQDNSDAAKSFLDRGRAPAPGFSTFSPEMGFHC